ncbi:uncharacterized protein A4U43_C01F19970 [Asparagus officinalis]|uniref:SWIM-type domain-containing protein n=1 Tax=Asparagus officinalis TaxID=4686 RepID=A0A5P1FV98_ASPOF|nr:uncharacterized protein LOC109826148 [Asparagus officinalis]XP_020248730.1 uncharacterized protein LOC109826148 [Asparagus officinalis]XP_020248738.1 uncharacterized protein LOC109826148 [Asparagus officinalis]XP_020248745.1 uncharacterized protein LOC109826148 [Asparagus officinalis]ONK80630.1 uncharacterized protein A4U43_C01F19970 [Asparagus officinalis]
MPTMVEGTVVAICQYGGEFVTNRDGSLSYTGGDARAVDVGHDMLLEDFKSEIASTFDIDISGMSIKYLLPSNKRVLITISNDKDLQRMVAHNAQSMSIEVYIINKVDSSTSIAVTAAAQQNGKRKRPTSGSRAPKKSLQVADSHTPIAFNSVTENAVDSDGQNRSTITGNVENSATELVTVHSALPVFMSSATSTNDIGQQGVTTVDNFDERSILADPSIPNVATTVATLGTCDDTRPLNLTTLWDDIITGVGQEFDNVKEFRGQLCKYAIGKGFVYKFVKNESTRVTVRCNEESCPWRIHASESSQKQKFVIKKMNNVHTCGGGNGKDGQRKATRQWLTDIIKEKLQASLPCKPKEIVQELYEDYGVSLSYSQVWRGREDAQKELYSLLKETYSQLPWLCERILETNPGSVALLSASIDSKVRRFYVSFHASLHGFEHGCRPLIFLDRIPLKGNTQCKLLTAAALDGDDAIFPLAFAAVEDESYDTWVWFLSQLRYAVGASRAITFISNRQKGLDVAVPQVFVDSHHSYCLRHLIEDFKLELKKGPWSQQLKDNMVDDFIRAAQACTIEDFNASIESIRNISSEAAEWVAGSKPENWSDAIFRGSRYDHFSSNIVDSLTNWIPVKSESSIMHIVEAIRNKLTEMMQTRKEVSSGWMSMLTPTMEQKLEKEISKSRKLYVLCSSETVFEVRGNTIYVVNIGNWECTCRRWQLSGLPCSHAFAVFNRINRSVYDYCSKYFRTDYYHSAYSEAINPIPGVESIDFNSGANLYPPPAQRPPGGRPRRKRFNPNKTVTVIRLCSRCKVAGHNKATCEAFL